VAPTSLSELQSEKRNYKERHILYLPGRLATFITLDPPAGIHGCLFYNVVHDDGWFLGIDATDNLFIRDERLVRQAVPNWSLLHLSLIWRHNTIYHPQKGLDPTTSIPLSTYVKTSALTVPLFHDRPSP
jgi:hypothetical protein